MRPPAQRFPAGRARPGGATEWSTDALSVGSHTITLEATDSDGQRDTDVIALVVNGMPSAPDVSIAPDPAYTDDDLVASIGAASVDLVCTRHAHDVDVTVLRRRGDVRVMVVK